MQAETAKIMKMGSPEMREEWMRAALAEARKAAEEGEVPVGAIVVVVALRLGAHLRSGKTLTSKFGKGPRSRARLQEAAVDSSWMKLIVSWPTASASSES